MGQTVGKLLHKLFSTQRQLKILMLGLDAAGKTAILQRLKLGQTVGTVPTIGFNVESLVYKNLSFVVWDVGGQDKIRFLWQHYFQGTQGLIFVVDSSDRERMVEVKSEFHKIASDPRLADTKVLVFANKKDLRNTMEIEEIIDRMGLPLIPQKDWHVQSSCAITGDGLADGLDWLAHAFDLQTNY